MATAQSHTAKTTKPLPVGIVIEVLLSDLTPEEFEALFGAEELDTVPMELAQ